MTIIHRDKESLDLLTSHSEHLGLSVTFQRTPSCIYFETREIFINSRSSTSSQLFALAHEIGHYYERIYGRVLPYADFQSHKSITARVMTVIEEYEAWKRGYSLLNRLGIQFDSERFNKAMVKSLMSYFRWAVLRF